MSNGVLPIQVAAAVLQQPVANPSAAPHAPLLTLAVRRSAGALRGYWEFPGGKREHGESMRCCLSREIEEELGLQIRVGELLGVNTHAGSSGTIELHAYLVTQWTGDIRLVVHDEFRWLGTDQLDSVMWSPADIPLVRLLGY